MITLTFESIEFHEGKEDITLRFLKLYSAKIAKKDLLAIAPFTIARNSISFKDDKSHPCTESHFNTLLAHSFEDLTNILTGKPTAYINRFSGIPLLGSLYFGIVDKGSTMLEVKPLTGCNLNCVFCSVDEGPSSKKTRDIVVEEAYLIQELEKLMAYKLKHQPETQIDVYINPHGEPTLYAELLPLVRDMKAIKGIRGIILITNGLLIDKSKVDALKEAGATSINFSVHATQPEKAAALFGVKSVPITAILETIAYANSVMDVYMAPVFVPGINDKDIEDVLEFCKKHNIMNIGIQNFLHNRQGRNPAKSLPWEQFHEKMQAWEQQFGMKLLMEPHGKVAHTPEYPSPFRKDEVVKAIAMGACRYAHDLIAVARDRSIMVSSAKSAYKKGDTIRLKITRTLHNVFFGVEV